MVCEYAHSEDHALCPSGWGLIQTFPPSSRGGLVRTIDPNSSLLTLNLDLTLDALPYKERGLHYPCIIPAGGAKPLDGRSSTSITGEKVVNHSRTQLNDALNAPYVGLNS